MIARMPRILHAVKLVPGAQFGSLEEQICLLAPEVERIGGRFIPLFAETRDGPREEYWSRGIDAQHLNLTRFNAKTLTALLGLLRDYQIDVVHWNILEPIRNPYVWALTVLSPGVRHWMTDHISRPGVASEGAMRGARLKNSLMRRYDVVFCVSRFVQQCVEQQLPNTRSLTQYHFINTERFRPDPAMRAQLRQEHAAGDKLLALMVAHLTPEKGVDVALQALADLDPRFCLWVVGEGPEREGLTRRAAQLGIGDRVRFFGQQSRVEPFIQAADVLLCPSLWAEAAGLVNIEAQACGLPVVASRIGGIPEYVNHEQTGLLFEPGDPRDLARQLTCLFNERGLYERLASAARPWVIEMFSPARRIPEILEYYRTFGGRRCN
jgi:glycosyltransferase involved in cell wall biosynthesis